MLFVVIALLCGVNPQIRRFGFGGGGGSAASTEPAFVEKCLHPWGTGCARRNAIGSWHICQEPFGHEGDHTCWTDCGASADERDPGLS
jgi:hypothetical protein